MMKSLIIFTLGAVLLVTQTSLVAHAQNNSWRIYSPPDKSFSVELPVPLVKVKSFDGKHGVDFDPEQNGKGNFSYAAIETVPEDSRFGIIVLNGRSRFLRSQKREKSLEYLSWFLIADEDELQFMRPPVEAKQNGMIGKEYFYVKEVTINDPLFTRGRIFDTGNKIYVLVFIGRNTKDLTSPDAERFFNSFRLRQRNRNR
jgi:hypothetical protein